MSTPSVSTTNAQTASSPAPRKIVVIGGSGLIGSRVVKSLRALGHEVSTASPSSGVNTVTGEGLHAALTGADVVVDVTNSPSFADDAVMEFFQKAGRNIAAAEQATGVKHHVALSVVGTERLQSSGYFRAKLVQEELIQSSGIPYTIVRATQFFEFIGAIAQSSVQGEAVRPSTALFQPIAADDVAAAVVDATVAAPINGMIEVAGPERISLAAAVRAFLTAQGDPRPVTDDPSALYFGQAVDDRSLTADDNARIGPTHLATWLQANPPAR